MKRVEYRIFKSFKDLKWDISFKYRRLPIHTTMDVVAFNVYKQMQ